MAYVLSPEDYIELMPQVRLLIGDQGTPPMFSNDELEAVIKLTGGHPLRAAAQALDIMATSETMLSKRISSQDMSVDGTAVAAELRRQAEALRDRADKEDAAASDFAFHVVEAPFGSYRNPELTEFGPW